MARKKKIVEDSDIVPVDGKDTSSNFNIEEKLLKLQQECIKKYGSGVFIKMGDSGSIGKVDFLPTGLTNTDDALGGGLAKGRVIEVFGPESSGKTTLTLHAIASAQKQGPCAFIDTEHAFDPQYAESIGVKVSELWVSQPDDGEQALNILEDIIDTGVYALAVVDSVAALTPRAEIQGEMGDAHVGLQARLMSQALRKIVGKLGKTKTVVIFTNQIRMKIGVMFGNPETTCVHPDTMVDVIIE